MGKAVLGSTLFPPPPPLAILNSDMHKTVRFSGIERNQTAYLVKRRTSPDEISCALLVDGTLRERLGRTMASQVTTVCEDNDSRCQYAPKA
jgi:hypothetical protein